MIRQRRPNTHSVSGRMLLPLDFWYHRRQPSILLGLFIIIGLITAYVYYDAGIPLSSPPSLLSTTTAVAATTEPTIVADQKVYDAVATQPGEDPPVFEFLDPVDMTKHMRARHTYQTIDQAHRQGLYHTGVWIHVTDSTGQKLLLLKRGPHLVTCPNSWGLVGEHTNRDETPLETVQRALVEELWGGRNATYTHRVQFLRKITDHPVFYLRDYGPSRQYRIDRQITYLYEVGMKHTSDQVVLELDDEVADHQWISLDDYRQWMQRDATTKNYVDFCHSTITRLGNFALEKLLHTKERQEYY